LPVIYFKIIKNIITVINIKSSLSIMDVNYAKHVNIGALKQKMRGLSIKYKANLIFETRPRAIF
jgi:hypothetical protein